MGFRWKNRRDAARLGGALVLAISLAGCGHPVQRKLEGRWVGDSVENFNDQDIAVATGWAKGTSLEFAGSQVTVTIPAEDPRSGSYKVAAVHKTDVRLAVSRNDGSVDKVHFKLDDERAIRWMLSDGRAVVLRKE